MSTLESDWRAALDTVDAELIDEYQSGVPIERRPFRSISAALGISEEAALSRVQRLREAGVFRRFGAVLNPPVIGSSTLAAVQASDDRFEEIAATINSYQQVNHNYRRDHEWNMWFVITAASHERRDQILEEIAAEAGDVLVLPLLTDYYINLEFPVMNTDRFARESLSQTAVSATQVSEDATADLSTLDRRLLVAIQDGLPLTRTPYADVAEAIDADTEVVVETIDRLLENGCIKRIGCVVNHVATGFNNNCMVVWDIPPETLDSYGERVGALPYVTLCYHRPRRPEQDWPYTLFTMIHGRDVDAVEERIDELATDHLPFEHERLYSTETLKQTGARYESLLSD